MNRRKSDRIASKSLSRFTNTSNSPVEIDSDDDTNQKLDCAVDVIKRRKKRKVVHSSDNNVKRRMLKKENNVDEEEGLDIPVKWFRIVNRCTPKQFCKGLQSLKPKQKEAIKKMGFGKLLSFKVNGIPQKISHYIVDRLDVTSMEILGREGPIKVNEEAVFGLLGVPKGVIDLKNVNPTKNLCKKIQEWRNLYTNDYISPSELVKRFTEAGDDDSFNFKLDFLMLFLSTIVECHAHGKCKLDVLNYLADDTDISNVNWCSYIIDCIEKCKSGWLPNTKSPFKGPLALLTLLYVDNVQCKRMNVDHTKAPIEFWNMEKLKQREALELVEISKSGDLGNMIDLDRMLDQTICNKKRFERAIVKQIQKEPKNHMVRLMAEKYERIFNEKPFVVQLKEKEVINKNEEAFNVKKNEETSSIKKCTVLSDDTLGSGLRDDIDDRIMDVCLEINRRRQKWIESDDDEEDVDLETGKKNNEDTDDNNNHEVDLGCPSFSLGFTHEQSGDKVCIDKPDQVLNQRVVVDEFPTFSLGLTQEGNQEEYNKIIGKGLSENMKAGVVSENVTIADRKFVGKTKKDILLEKNSANVPKQGGLKDIENEVVQDSCMKAVMLKDEIPTFSLGLTQEVRREETNKFTGQREIGDDKTMTFVADKMNAADGKMMGRSKSEIVAEKFGASGAMNEGINAPRPKVGRWTKADILAEKRKAMAKIEAKKGDSENKIKVEPKQGLMNQNVSEKEAKTTNVESKKTANMDSLNNDITKSMEAIEVTEASKTIDQTVVVKSKRLKGVSRECKSPYLLREVEITNRCNKEENSVWDYIVKLSDEKQPAKGSKKVVLGSEEANSDCNEMEVIFETSNGPMTEAKFFKTLIPGNRIYGELIDCWATVLNAEEKLRSPDSPYRLFCGHRVFLKWMFTAPKTDESVRLVALTKMMFDAVGRVESMRALKSYDIVIIPLLENDHFYVMAFDLKNPGIYLLDNMDRDETIVSIKDHKDYYKKDTPYKVKHMFVRYLEKFQHPRADKISMQKVTRVDLQWATIGNITDCGIFAMRHMEMFMGSHCRNFDCGFKTSEKQVRSQIQTLRKKYACRILLSDINVQKQKLLAKVGL
ncbi:hypothetical protein E3N88_14993 [Mikania micrantha]|uniref:Ubiquitin-like protease family profile domain-containing protein n=1 Tax=Mikania micrantha TaxID=192012 RepID=A0A5N6P501_9ASTR|nr:hypothetical protein E3N88_14993 [Mikania micrantha]